MKYLELNMCLKGVYVGTVFVLIHMFAEEDGLSMVAL
jgi:hypothetical protein